jgi:hypothetical protein
MKKLQQLTHSVGAVSFPLLIFFFLISLLPLTLTLTSPIHSLIFSPKTEINSTAVLKLKSMKRQLQSLASDFNRVRSFPYEPQSLIVTLDELLCKKYRMVTAIQELRSEMIDRGASMRIVHKSVIPTLDEFQFIRPIAKGAYGRVCVVKKKRTGDVFAVKLLNRKDTFDNRLRENVISEVSDCLFRMRDLLV